MLVEGKIERCRQFGHLGDREYGIKVCRRCGASLEVSSRKSVQDTLTRLQVVWARL